MKVEELSMVEARKIAAKLRVQPSDMSVYWCALYLAREGEKPTKAAILKLIESWFSRGCESHAAHALAMQERRRKAKSRKKP